MIKNMKLSFQIGAVFIGTVVGAGFATGQEIMQFFTRFGIMGMTMLLFTGVGFYTIAAAIMKVAARFNTYNYKELIYRVVGSRIGFVYDVLVTAFLLIGTSIMFAGSGALFQESMGFPRLLGIVVIALLTLLVILQALTGILRVNSIIVPVLFAVILTVLAATVVNSDIRSISGRLAENYPGSAVKPLMFFVFYCCYNAFLSMGVLAAMPEKIRNPSVLRGGVFFGATGLMLLSLMLNISLTLKSPQVFQYSIPMSFIISDFGKVIKNVVNVCIWCEIFSTAVSNAFSIAKRLAGNRQASYMPVCFIIVLCCLPLSFFEFKGLIGFFYPIFGVFSMFIVVKLLYVSHRLGRWH